MKKRAKPKPKRRAHQPVPAQQPSRAVAAAAVSLRTNSAPLQSQSAIAHRTRIAPAGNPAEDRATFALLMMPFMIVAVSLGVAQLRRASLPALPAIATHAPVERIAAAPAPIIPPTTPIPPTPAAHQIDVPGPVPGFPPPTPAVDPVQPAVRQPPTTVTAALDTGRPAPATPLPDLSEITRPAQPFPPPIPLVEPLPHVPKAALVPRPDQVAIPGPAPVFPPPTPTIDLPVVASPAPTPPTGIEIAGLDVRKPAPLMPPPLPADVARPQPPATTTETTCQPSPEKLASFSQSGRLARSPRQTRLVGVDAETFGRRLSAAALAQTEDLVIYTARYQAMAYPMGDVMAMHGACIDVIIRAYRVLGIDLQEDVQRGRPSRGDPNIDHRRTENMRRFLERHGTSVPVTHFPENYKPGDIVTYYRPFSRVSTSHIAIVTDVLGPSGRPMIVHNRGYGPQLEDALFVDKITGHYRYMGQPVPAAREAATTSKAQPVVRASFPR